MGGPAERSVGDRPERGSGDEAERGSGERGARPPGDKPVSGGEPGAVTGLVADPEEDEGGERRAPRAGSFPRRAGPNGAPGEEREGERGLRGLVGSGSSQVSVGAALRARDAARPSDAQLADADENLVIVRRNWTPREELPRR